MINNKHILFCLINNIPNAIFWKNTDLVFQGCNKQFCLQFGYSRPEDIIGKTDYDFPFSKDLIELYHLDDKKIISTGLAKTNYEEKQNQPDGTIRTMLVSKVPLYDDKNKIIGILGIYTDITLRKQESLKLTQALNMAQSANHAKSEFIANMSHDIRTPLTGVVGMSKMLEDASENPNQKKYAHFLGESGDQLLHMLNDIINVVSADNANDTDVHHELFDLHHMLNDLLQLERPTTLMKGLDFMVHIEDTVPHYFISDHTKIHRILLNLLGNAIKFTEQGHVGIKVRLLNLTQTNATLQFRVQDTGIGIVDDLQDKVFDRFYRVSPSYKGIFTGSGLGLHIAQSYAHLLGSDIKVDSQLDVGTTFYFDLTLMLADGELVPDIKPLNEMKPLTTTLVEDADAMTSRITQIAALNAPELLLVEDNAIALMMLETMANQAGLRYQTATDGQTALTLAMNHPFDAIITDLGLPELSGLELTSQFRAFEITHHKTPIPIIGLTAHADEKTKTDCIKAGMNAAFTKPITTSTLNTIAKQYLTSNNNNIAPVPNTQNIQSKGLGIDLPKTENELFELNDCPLLDANAGLSLVNHDISLFNTLLKGLIDSQIPNDLKDIEQARENNDWDSVEHIAHRMKGGFVCCGITRLARACQYLERYHKAGLQDKLPALYTQMITVTQETLDTINRWLSLQD